MNTTDLVEKSYLRKGLPGFRPGDTVKVHARVVEGNRERVQVFQGVVIRRSGGGLRETFTVRKFSFGVGVERTFPLHSPSIAKLGNGPGLPAWSTPRSAAVKGCPRCWFHRSR